MEDVVTTDDVATTEDVITADDVVATPIDGSASDEEPPAAASGTGTEDAAPPAGRKRKGRRSRRGTDDAAPAASDAETAPDGDGDGVVTERARVNGQTGEGELADDAVNAGAIAEVLAASELADREVDAVRDSDGEGEEIADGGLDAAPDGDARDAADADDESVVFPTSAASMEPEQLKHLVEALVFASDRPLTVQRLRQLTRVSDVRRLEAALATLAEDYRDRGVVLQQVSGGYQFRTRTQFSAWVQQLIAGRPVRLSRAQLETLAIIAYRQPITRPEIDDIRGVDSTATLKLLIDRLLIRVLGKREEVGRPMLYGTTKEFLDFFSLGDLRELPTLREYSELSAESRKVMSDRLGIAPDGSDPDGSDGGGGDDGNDGGSGGAPSGGDPGTGGLGGGASDDGAPASAAPVDVAAAYWAAADAVDRSEATALAEDNEPAAEAVEAVDEAPSHAADGAAAELLDASADGALVAVIDEALTEAVEVTDGAPAEAAEATGAPAELVETAGDSTELEAAADPSVESIEEFTDGARVEAVDETPTQAVAGAWREVGEGSDGTSAEAVEAAADASPEVVEAVSDASTEGADGADGAPAASIHEFGDSAAVEVFETADAESVDHGLAPAEQVTEEASAELIIDVTAGSTDPGDVVTPVLAEGSAGSARSLDRIETSEAMANEAAARAADDAADLPTAGAAGFSDISVEGRLGDATHSASHAEPSTE